VKAVLIGAGQIARQHLTCLEGIAGVEVAGICDLAPSVAECAAERHRVPRWFTDHRTMLAEVRPAVVHVTTPPGTHFRLAMDALEAGAHVVLEKPATATLAEVEQLARRAEQSSRALVEDYNYLFNRAPQQMLERIESGQLGSVVHVEVSLCLDILGPQASPTPTLRIRRWGSGAAPSPTSSPTLPRWRTSSSAGTARSGRCGPSAAPPSCRATSSERWWRRARHRLALFSSSSQPDAFWLRVYGTRMLASANLFETRSPSTGCARDRSRSGHSSTGLLKAGTWRGPRWGR
jgi:hypothetical protein